MVLDFLSTSFTVKYSTNCVEILFSSDPCRARFDHFEVQKLNFLKNH